MKMKKLAALALSAVFALGALTACGGSSSSGSVPAAASGSGSVSGASLKEVNIGLIQLMEHASLDEIRTAIEAGLEAKGAEYGVKVNVDYQNAQGDTSTINTICQQFVGNKVDAIVVIGGRNSSNTTRLADICAAACPRTHHIESPEEIDPTWFAGCFTVGVTAGASTPEVQISAVVARLEALEG